MGTRNADGRYSANAGAPRPDDATASEVSPGEATVEKPGPGADVPRAATRGETAPGKTASGGSASGKTASGKTASGGSASGKATSGERSLDKRASGKSAPGGSGSGETASGGSASGAGKGRLDEATLAELYRLHGGYLLRALIKMTNGDRGRAEDILQETFLRAWRNPAAIACGAAKCRPWLFTVARRIAIDHFRMVAARVQEIADEAPEDRTPSMDPFDAVLEACDIGAVLARLPAHHRDVMVELHLKGRSIADAAKALGVPPGTVKSRNHHAIRALRPMLEAAGHTAA